jgi:hypothetical protein
LKIAPSIIDRVEEYRYYSGGIGDVRQLTLKVLALRLRAFYAVTKRANAATKKGGSPKSKQNRKQVR